jgi:hypothetical protein
MNELKNKFIGEMLDLCFIKFDELEGKPIKENDKIIQNIFLFKTTYIGRHNWIKIIIPYEFLSNDIYASVEYKINNQIYKNDKIFVDALINLIKNIVNNRELNDRITFEIPTKEKMLDNLINEHNSFDKKTKSSENIKRIEYLYEEIINFIKLNPEFKDKKINLKCYDYNI